MDSTSSDREKFWDAQTFAIITDHTKPAMKWTASKLISRGKKVYVLEISEKTDPHALLNVSSLPPGIDSAVIGVTKTEPGDLIPLLEEKGIRNVWLHWNTETQKAVDTCQKLGLRFITGHCPMMYLDNGFNMHGIHRRIAKIMGNY
jgi:hypothetical protein